MPPYVNVYLINLTLLIVFHIGYAEHDGRTESSLLDLLQAFDRLEPNAVDWRDLERMCREIPWQLPVTSGIPDFPVERRKRRLQYGATDGSKHKTGSSSIIKRSKHDTDDKREHPAFIPAHFPAFPEKHTYSYSPIAAVEREKDPAKVIYKSLEGKKQVEEALVNVLINSGTNNAKQFENEHSSLGGQSSSVRRPSTTPLPIAFK